ncbi:MAG TPA: hypothetical protein VK139_04295, partial [Microbacteriaceae bacterium]|nr:hypothetical protein [Microbacteriaceae bacterium]
MTGTHMRDLQPDWATDVAILELTGSTVTDHGDHLVVRTPDNPDYHWGNCLLVTDASAVDDGARWEARFTEEFPSSHWLAVGLPALPTDTDSWTVRAIELEPLEVLTTRSQPRSAPLADGYTVRELTPDDFETMVQREL